MNVAATTAAAMVVMNRAAIRKLVQHFDQADATDAGRAIPLPSKAPRAMVKRLVRDRILVPVGHDRFYLDRDVQARAQARGSRAGGIVAIAVVIGLVILLALVLIGLTVAR
jgi:hypothetical protein